MALGARGQETTCWCENKEAKKTRGSHCPLGGGAGGFAMVLVLQKVLCGFAKVLAWAANVQGSRHW